jgi:hypothetical protein
MQNLIRKRAMLVVLSTYLISCHEPERLSLLESEEITLTRSIIKISEYSSNYVPFGRRYFIFSCIKARECQLSNKSSILANGSEDYTTEILAGNLKKVDSLIYYFVYPTHGAGVTYHVSLDGGVKWNSFVFGGNFSGISVAEIKKSGTGSIDLWDKNEQKRFSTQDYGKSWTHKIK